MKNINVSNDIVPIGEFKSGLSKWLKNIQRSGQHLVITQNGRPAGVLLSPAEYDELMHKQAFIESVNRGLADIESGSTYTTEEIRNELSTKLG